MYSLGLHHFYVQLVIITCSVYLLQQNMDVHLGYVMNDTGVTFDGLVLRRAFEF